jgi:hypothetical protein
LRLATDLLPAAHCGSGLHGWRKGKFMTWIIFVLLILSVPLALTVWLIVRAVSARNRLEELARRLGDLEAEVFSLKRSREPAPKTEATTPAAAPATGPKIVPPAPLPMPAAVVIPPVPPTVVVPPPIIKAPPVIVPIPKAAPEPEVLPVFISEDNINTGAKPPPIAEPAAVAGKESFEMRVGKYWAVRVGILIVLTSLAFAANLAYHNIVPKLGPGGKISLLYLASGLLLGAGAWWQRRTAGEALRNYAQVLFAGGLAAVYFTTYAAHHIEPLRVIESAVFDGTLLLVWAGVILWMADRRKSEVMALFAIGLAFYSSVITRVGEFTLYSNLILCITAVVFLVRNRWAGLSFASLVTSFAGYAFWRFLHADGWRWAAPGESLWLGAGFLACYWLVFTVATFLSKSEKLSGRNRAVFLTVNNGAFFGLFVLTMLQVHSGGFWKFSLGYGIVLLALAGLAQKVLPDEPLAKNAYLTKGLLLVTLGLITYFTGRQLALVLGAESVVLFLRGTQRQSVVLKIFAYVAALLATGWCVVSLHPFDLLSLWTGVALGAFMAVNGFRAHLLETGKNPPSDRLQTTAFTLLAFVSWTAAAWFYSLEPHLPATLVVGVASVVLFNLVARRQDPAAIMCAYLAAVLAVGWCSMSLSQFDWHGLMTGAVLGGLMIFNAYWSHRDESEDNEHPLRAAPSAFTLLAFAVWLATTWFNSSARGLPLVLAAEGVALTFSIYLLRVREITLLGQFFPVLAQVAWFVHFHDTRPPWWNALALIVVIVGLGHWWQKQRILVVAGKFSTGCQTLFAVAAVAVALAWLHPLVTAPGWLALTSLLAVAVTLYGVATRAWPLAICGQIFLAVSGWEFLTQVFTHKPEWYFPLAPLAALGLMSFATVGWFSRRPDGDAKARGPLLQIARVYRWTALLMSLGWIWQYVPDRQHAGAFMAAACGIFALAVWRRNREALIAVSVYAFTSVFTIRTAGDLRMDIYWMNALALLALLAMQQILRRMPERFSLEDKEHAVIIFVAGFSLWRFVSCWTATFTGGFFLTMTWAGFAVLLFVAGMLLHERFHRWLGLGVLAAAVGRVVLVDVWKQETIYRVLTFLALGVALLLVGFIYNKFQDMIRKWL